MICSTRPERSSGLASRAKSAICAECLGRQPCECLPSVTDTVWVRERASLFAKFRFDFCSRHLQVLEVGAAGRRLRQRAWRGPESAASGSSRHFPLVGCRQRPGTQGGGRAAGMGAGGPGGRPGRWSSRRRALVANKRGATPARVRAHAEVLRGRGSLPPPRRGAAVGRGGLRRRPGQGGRRRSWPSTPGPGERSSITGRRSATLWGSAEATRPTRRRSPHGWARRSPRTRLPRTGCERRCWPAADPSTSSHPAAGRADHRRGPFRGQRPVRATTAARLGLAAADRLEQLVADRGEEYDEGGRRRGCWRELKADPGQISRDSLLAEVDKLERIRSLGLPAGLFAGAPDHVVGAWRARAALEYPSDLRERPRRRCASPCWPPCAGLAPVRSPTAWWNCSSASCTRSTPGPRTGSRASCWPTCAGCGARRASCSASPRPPRTPRRHGPHGAVPGGQRGHPARPGPRGQGDRGSLQDPGPQGAALVVLQLLPPDAAPAARRAASSGPTTPPTRPVIDALDLLGRYAGRPGTVRFYAARRDRAVGRGRPGRLGDRGGRRAGPGRADPLRAVRAPRPARRRCAAARYGWWAPTAGGTPRRTCPPTSRSAARSTTPLCGSPSIRPRSSTSSAAACAPPWPASTLRSARTPPAGCSFGHPAGRTVDHRPQAGQAPRAGQPGPPQGPRSGRAGAPSTCSTSRTRPTSSPT